MTLPPLFLGPYRLVFVWPEMLALAGLAALAAAWLDRRAGGSRRGALLRGLVVLAIGAALADPSLDLGADLPLLVLADRSASVAPGAIDQALARIAARQPDFGRLDFGGAAASPLAEALGAARRALPGGGRVLVLSDGRATGRDPVPAAARAAVDGLRVDALALPGRPGPDAVAIALEAPPAARAGEIVPLIARLGATSPLTATARLYVEDRLITEAAVSLGITPTAVAWRYPTIAPGDLRFRAEVQAPDDVEPANDIAHAVTHVAPPARVLIIGEGAGAVGLADALGRQGIAPTVAGPARVPSRLSQLEAWDVLVLADTPAAALGLDQLAAIQAFAADLGRGVLLTGGRRSFLPGGWENTPLAELAPLALDPPPRDEREPIALLLLVDQSASMGSIEGRGALSKLDLAREAAILSAEVLHPGDMLGVVTYDDSARWLLPFSAVGPGRALTDIEQALGGLSTGGGTRILSALELGLPAIAGLADIPTRHAVLLSDGRDVNPDAEGYDAALRAAAAAGVTLSAIAIGADVDRDLLAHLARLGRGRFHSAAEPADLPRLAVEESEIVRARSEQSGAFHAAPPAGAPHPALAGIDVAALPELGGYLAMRPREGADVALEAPNRDPLLAAWNYGLGRVAAWTSDTGEEWAATWIDHPIADAFWSRLVRYVARAPDAGPPGARVTWHGPRAHVEVDANDPADRPLDLAEATLVITGTAGADRIPLPQTAPGRYAGDVDLPGPGAYPAAVTVDPARAEEADGAAPQTVPVPLAWDYADELRPTGSGEALLAKVAAAGGGALLASSADVAPAAPASDRISLWPWLLGAAALLWVGDVARTTQRIAKRIHGLSGLDRL